jgi:hypothetical protein
MLDGCGLDGYRGCGAARRQWLGRPALLAVLVFAKRRLDRIFH